jgi:hypothetical protein
MANYVGDNPALVKQIGGTGPVINDLEWDVKLYSALNAGVHDAACAAWSLKRYYDGWRPVEAIRYMASFGQCSQPSSLSYHTNGLPLVPGLIEVVTAQTAQPGGRHAGLPVGVIALFAWPGQPANYTTAYSGVHWVVATNWYPYQRATFVTPSFAGYISGHSCFSRAAAEVLAAFTGTPFFPGGLGVYSNFTLAFEKGPSQPVQLQWATYFDASDQAGISRLWGGIHVSVDDLTGRVLGSQCGQGVWALAKRYFDGSVTQIPTTVTIQSLTTTGCQLNFNTLRGFAYQLQSSTSLNRPFTNEPGGLFQALDSSMSVIGSSIGSNKFFRVTTSLGP